MSSWDQANRPQKLGFGLEKQKENQPNYQRLLSLTVLPLNYFMLPPIFIFKTELLLLCESLSATVVIVVN